MGIGDLVRKMTGGEREEREERDLAFADSNLFGGLLMLSDYATTGGVSVTPDNAMSAAAVLACVGRVAKDLATLPIHVIDRDNGRRVDHPTARLLRNPNEYMTSASLKQSLVMNLLLWGNAYLAVERAGLDAQPTTLLPMLSRHTRARRRGGDLFYETSPLGEARGLGADRVIHIPYLPLDGLVGQGPIQVSAKTVGVSIALADFAGRYFAQGSHLDQNAFELPPMNEAALTETRRMLREQFSGPASQHKRLALPGLKVHKLTYSLRESQALEARDFQLREVCRVFGVPVGIVDPEKSKYAGLESMYRDYQQATLRPIAVAIEEELARKLFSEADRDRYGVEFNLDAIVRASLADRMEADAKGVQAGILTPNEARDHHRLPPTAGGDQLLRPMNMTPHGRSRDDATEERSESPRPAPETPLPAQTSDSPEESPRVDVLVRSIAQGIAVKEVNAARRAAGKEDEFDAWAQTWFADHMEHLATRLPILTREQAASLAADARDSMVKAHAAENLDQLLAAWPNQRPDKVAAVAAASPPTTAAA